jgi:hypothetical protein
VPAAEPVSEHAGPGPRLQGLAGVQQRGGGPGVDGPQGAGKEFGVLDSLGAVRFGADPQDTVFLGDGAAVAVIGLALRIPAARGPHVQALAAGPGNGQGDFPHRIRRLVVLRLGIHVAQDNGADLGHGYRLGGDLGDDLLAGLIELLVVHVGDHQHVRGKDQHRDVAADLGPVKMGFQMHQMGHAFAAVQRVVNNVGHQERVETGLLECVVQAQGLRRVAV